MNEPEKIPNSLSREEAKRRWETFEQGDERFPFPRKNNRYIAELVISDGGRLEAINRAKAIFDNYPWWIIRAEGYLELAKAAAKEHKADIGRAIIEFTLPLLAGFRSGKFEGDNEGGTIDLDNILLMLTDSVAIIGEEERTCSFRHYLKCDLPLFLRDQGLGEERTENYVTYYSKQLELKVTPESFCIRRMDREQQTQIFNQLGYLSCDLCPTNLDENGDVFFEQDPCRYV